jgi:DNA repair exonuclease SbcCD ATPase subunit
MKQFLFLVCLFLYRFFLIEVLDRKRKDEIKAIEDRKHVMIDYLMNEHQKAFMDIKNYYNDITHNNLDLIKSLKEEVKDLESEERKDQLKLYEKMSENKKLSAPLKKMQDDVIALREQLEEYRTEKQEMKKVKANLLIVENNQNTLLWEQETLLLRLEDLKKEKNELELNLKSSIYEVKQKAAFKGMLLEKKLNALSKIQEEREAQLNEVLSRANLEPTLLGQVKGHVDDILMRKNSDAKRLQNEILRMQSQYDYLQEFMGKKLLEYGLTVAELGFVPANPGQSSSSAGVKPSASSSKGLLTSADHHKNNNNNSLKNFTMTATGPSFLSETY